MEIDGYDGKRESSGTERNNDFCSASPYFYDRHEFNNNGNSCRKSTKDHSSSSKSSSRSARDYFRESPLRRDSSYQCYSKEKLCSSRIVLASLVMFVMCVVDRTITKRSARKGHISRECSLRESEYSIGHSSDRRRHHGHVQRKETGVLYILVGVDMRTKALSVLVRLGLLAVTILLVAIMTVCLLSIRAAPKLLDVVGLLNLCIEKG